LYNLALNFRADGEYSVVTRRFLKVKIRLVFFTRFEVFLGQIRAAEDRLICQEGAIGNEGTFLVRTVKGTGRYTFIQMRLEPLEQLRFL
jgi:hypothetical protein